VLLAAAAIILTTAQAGMALNSDDSLDNAGPIEILEADAADRVYNSSTLPMFYVDLDENLFTPGVDGEFLTLGFEAYDNLTLRDDDGIVYESKAWADEYGRMNIAWLGEKYLAVGNDVNKLTKYLVDFNPDENLTLGLGDVWDIGEGFTLEFKGIDKGADRVWLILEKDGSLVDDIIVDYGGYGYYNDTLADESDVVIARIHVDTVSEDINEIIINDVQIISMDVTELIKDEYFGMDFSSSANSLMLRERDGTTNLYRGMTVGIIPDFLSIRVGDTQYPEPVRLYVFSEITPQELYKQHGPIINSTAEAPGSIILDANDLPMFYKDLDAINFNPENNKGESLTINLSSVDEIADNGIIYTSRAWNDTNGRMNIAWLGEKYLAVGDNVTKLTKYVVDFNSSEDLTLELGDVWDMGDDFTLNFTEIDKTDERVHLVLEKDGIPLALLSAIAGETVYYNDTVAGESDVVVARIHVRAVLVDTNMTIIDDVQIISLDVTELDLNEYFGMDFSSTASSIMLIKTDGPTSLERGNTVEIIPDFLNIRVSDTLLDRFYVSRVDRDAIPSGPKVTIFAPSSPVSNVIGTTRTFKIMADQTVNVTWYINGTEVQFNESVSEAEYTNTSAAIGTWNVTVVAQNNNGTDLQEWEWMVTAQPMALITEPEEGAFVNGIININGTANAIDFNNYSVEWRKTVDWTEIFNSIESVPVGTLATWDTTDVEDGNYSIRLTVTDNAYNSNETKVNVTIDNTPPEINTVMLNTTTPNTDDDILITVNTTDNNGVTSVIANGSDLNHEGGGIWNGTITALAGTHFVNVSCKDDAGNIVWNNSASYAAMTTDFTFYVRYNVSGVLTGIEGATVSLHNIKIETDADGTAVFTKVTFGDYRYKVRMKGFKQTSGIVNVNGITTMEVELIPKK